MPGEANSWRGSATTRTWTSKARRMSWTGSFRLTLVIIAILGLPALMVDAVPHVRAHQRTIRLCSKSLSDALYLVCRDRGGYNEPFSYSGEEEARAPSGPGLVEECCYRPCSLEQLESYCKPALDDKSLSSQDGIEESLRIVNLPYSSMRELAAERRSNAAAAAAAAAASGSNERTTKSKNRKSTRINKLDCNARNGAGRKHGYHVQRGLKGTKIREAERRRMRRIRARRIDNRANRDDDVVNDEARDETARRECRRRRRWRRRRRGKALREAAAAIVPDFKVGTTLPEPKDSLLLFPSRVSLGFQEVSQDLGTSIEDSEALKKSNALDADDRNLNKHEALDRALAIGRS